MMLEDFEDAGAEGWLASGNWGIDTSAGGDKSFKCTGEGTALAGVPMWGDYIMSVDLKSLSAGGEAGIVFHATDALNFYFLSVTQSAAQWSVWKYVNGVRQGSPSNPLAGPKSVAITEPMTLRMTRLDDGRFLCYVNGTHLEFNDTSYTGGMVGLRVESGSEATFDNVQVFGGYGFLENGAYEVLFSDPMDHLDLDGTPYMWALKGVKPSSTLPAWEVVNAGAAYGKVLRGTASGDPAFPTEAVRGDRSWINDEDEYMNYRIQANVKLESTDAVAGLCLRVRKDDNGGTNRLYILQLTGGAEPKLRLAARRWHSSFPPHWEWDELPLGWVALPNPTQWHTIAMEAVDNRFQCYLDGLPCITTSDDHPPYHDGLVGLWVETSAALFDNVLVLDLREY